MRAERLAASARRVDDIIWGTSAQVGEQTGDIGRMSALDAGYDVRASGVTLDRFCGSGVASANMAAASICRVRRISSLPAAPKRCACHPMHR